MPERRFLVGLAVVFILCAATATIYITREEPDPFAIDFPATADLETGAEHEIDIDVADDKVVITLSIDTDNLSDLNVSATGDFIDISANVKRESGNGSFTYRMQHAQSLPVSVDPDSLVVRQEPQQVVITLSRPRQSPP